MGYDMEELLKKMYSQKEEPTQEFCKSVMGEMKAKEGKVLFWKMPEMRNRGFFAAACFGILLLTAFAVKVWTTGNHPDRGNLSAQFAQESGLPAPAAVDSAGLADRDSYPVPGAAGQPNPSDYPINPEESKNKPQIKKTPLLNDTHPSWQEASVPKDLSFLKPGEQTMEPAGRTPQPTMDSFSSLQTGSPPQLEESPQPLEPPQPGVLQPSSEILAGADENGADDNKYVSLCSMETKSCVYRADHIDKPDAVPGSMAEYTEKLTSDFPEEQEEAIIKELEGFFGNQMLFSYEQLQEMLQAAKAEPELQQWQDALEWIVGKLETYDSNSFSSSMFCVNLLHLRKGTDLELADVKILDREQGKTELNIQINQKQPVPAQAESSGAQSLYLCVVRVPKEIAGKCNCIVFESCEKKEGER